MASRKSIEFLPRRGQRPQVAQVALQGIIFHAQVQLLLLEPLVFLENAAQKDIAVQLVADKIGCFLEGELQGSDHVGDGRLQQRLLVLQDDLRRDQDQVDEQDQDQDDRFFFRAKSAVADDYMRISDLFQQRQVFQDLPRPQNHRG